MCGIKKLIPKVTNTIKKHKLISENEHILIAVSGGPDSIALLHILYHLKHDYNLRLGIVHFEHGIRGESSLRDAKFVERVAKSLNLPFYISYGKAREYAKEKKLSLEAAARELRYNFFNEILSKTKADKLALGHTADDQVEEILRRFLRGTADLSGIPIKRGKFIRPLLFVYKEEILKALKEDNIDYVIDETNLDRRFFRNRIRLDLIPILLKFNPKFKENLLDMALIWKEENEWLKTLVKEVIKKSTKRIQEGVKIDLSLFSQYHPALKRHILTEILQELSLPFTKRHIENLLKIAIPYGPHKIISLPKGFKGYKESAYLFITPVPFKEIEYHYEINAPGIINIKEINLTFKIEIVEKKPETKIDISPDKAYFDFEKVSFPIEIRPYKPGDRFYPIGRKRSRKLKDFFIDSHIPYSERKKYPIFLSDKKIIWIAGLCMDERAKPTSKTKKCLIITKLQ